MYNTFKYIVLSFVFILTLYISFLVSREVEPFVYLMIFLIALVMMMEIYSDLLKRQNDIINKELTPKEKLNRDFYSLDLAKHIRFILNVLKNNEMSIIEYNKIVKSYCTSDDYFLRHLNIITQEMINDCILRVNVYPNKTTISSVKYIDVETIVDSYVN